MSPTWDTPRNWLVSGVGLVVLAALAFLLTASPVAVVLLVPGLVLVGVSGLVGRRVRRSQT